MNLSDQGKYYKRKLKIIVEMTRYTGERVSETDLNVFKKLVLERYKTFIKTKFLR